MVPSEKYTEIDQLAEEFAARLRRGEHPSYQEYVERYPRLADEIRELFPALVEMERVEVPADGFASANPPLRQVGDYRIIREVGRGGMGVVYEAEQQSLGRRVALKIMPGRMSRDGSTLERFKREARTAAQLHHTNIVPVFDVGQDGETCYYAMQFIQGQGLDQVIVELCRLRSKAVRETDRPEQTAGEETPADAAAAGPVATSLLTGRFAISAMTALAESSPSEVPVTLADGAAATYAAALPGHTDRSSVRTNHGHYFRSVARIGEQAAAAVGYAHDRGIIHRDIKPSNLLLDTAGTVWITDFGLAKCDDDGLTKSGDVLGTFRYMAPERFSGLGDARGDIYSLALTLYELLLLKPAFNSPDRLHLIEQVKQCQVERPRSVDPRIPRDLETIVLKAMDREPRRRYQTAKQFSDDLRRFLAGEPIEARRTGELERLGLWCRRNPLIATMVGAVAVLLLVLTMGATLSAFWLRNERDLAISNESRAVKAENAASVAKSDALAKLWDSSLVAARAGRMSRSPGQRFASIRAIEQALALPLPPGRSKDDLRTEAIASLVLPDLEVSKEWPGWPTGSRGFAIDNTFQRYARGDADGNVSVRRIADDKELFRLPGGGPSPDTYGAIGFSPDGRYLYQNLNQNSEGSDHRIWRVDLDPPTRVVPDDCWTSEFSPDSRQVAALFRDGTMRFYELPSGRPAREFRIPGFKPYRLVWNPRRPMLAACDRFEVRFINVNTGRVEWILPVPEFTNFCDWHPEGRLIAVTGRFGSLERITLWDTVTHLQVMSSFEALKTDGIFVTFDRTGDRLMTTDWSHNWRLWDRRTGKLLLTRPAGGNGIWFSQDDRSVGLDASGKNLRLYRFASGAELCTLTRRGPDPSGGFNGRECCPLDPEGRLIAIFGSDGFSVVDVVRGEEVAFVALPAKTPEVERRPWASGTDESGALLTHGPAGLLRWPLTVSRDGKRSYGPPTKLLPRMSGYGTSPGTGADGREWAFPRGKEGAIVLLLPEEKQIALKGQSDVRSAAVSPDGSWIATGSHNVLDGPGAKIWDARTGRLVHDLPVGEYCNVSFSPGGKWLVTTSGVTRLWSVGTWRPGAAFSDANDVAAFMADDSLVALPDAAGVVRLVVPETGRELARLTAPDAVRLSPLCFTRDGRRLVCGEVDSGLLLIFDLGLIREELAPMGLDWDAPPIVVAKQPQPDAIEVSFISDTDPAAIHVKRSEVNRQTLEVAVDPFNATKRLDLGIRLCDFGDRENGDLQIRFALALGRDLPETRSYRSRLELGACGIWHVEHERWARAAADYVLLSEIEPDVSERALQSAALLLTAGERAGYHDLCRRMLQRFANTSSPNDAERTAKACLISGELKDELPEAARLAEFAARKGAKSGDHVWFELTAGIADYRESLYSAAARRLAKNRDATKGIEVLNELTSLFEAMSLIKSGDPKRGQQLIEAVAPLVNNRFGHKPDDLSFNWHDWLFARLALQEAQRLLDDASKSAK